MEQIAENVLPQSLIPDIQMDAEQQFNSSPMPLTEPPFAVEPPSRFERLSRFVPLVGWTVAAALERERRTPKAQHIAHQLEARTETTERAWGHDPHRRAVAASVSTIIRDEFEWPNSRFLPDDRINLLMWTIGDGFTPISCAYSIEKRLAVTLGSVTSNWWKMTLGQLVDHILLLPQNCRKCGYDLRASPERCPECGTVPML